VNILGRRCAEAADRRCDIGHQLGDRRTIDFRLRNLTSWGMT
jgi:hypothetical protein